MGNKWRVGWVLGEFGMIQGHCAGLIGNFWGIRMDEQRVDAVADGIAEPALTVIALP